MDPKLLRYYERELQHLRETGGEFAKEFPKIAGRLGLESFACADPYVERLLEGFSFLAARIQLKIDAQFPVFTSQLLELLYPHYLAPTPSMAVVQFQPDLSEADLAKGLKVPRATSLRSLIGKDEQTPCEYRTSHEITLLPIELIEAKYSAYSGQISGSTFTKFGSIKSFLKLRLLSTAGLKFSQISLNSLNLYLRGSESLPTRILEQFHANALGIAVMSGKSSNDPELILKDNIRTVGFDENQSMFPYDARSFQGYRYLQEYFAFPQRYMFVELCSLLAASQRCETSEIDIIIFFDQFDSSLEHLLNAENFSLFCTPVINLFPKRVDRIHLSNQQSEFHVVPDRTRPMDFEIYGLSQVTGFGSNFKAERELKSLYAGSDLSGSNESNVYYQIKRTSRLASDKQRRSGSRTSYLGSEIYLSLVDPENAPYSSDLLQLGIEALCTNRDLPLIMPLSISNTDFTTEFNGPIKSIRCVAGPSVPVPSHIDGDVAWRAINHFSLNYLSLVDTDIKQGAEALRTLLKLYLKENSVVGLRQIEGLRFIESKPIVKRMGGKGPANYCRGLKISLTLDENAFEGSGMFLFGMVLENFFSKYVSINSFTQTSLESTTRGEIMCWPARGGICQIL